MDNLLSTSEFSTSLKVLCFIFIFFEIIYSFYKKDNKHSFEGTKNNILNAFLLIYVSNKMLLFYFLFIFIFIPKININSGGEPFKVYSFFLCFVIMDFLLYVLHRTKHIYSPLWTLHSFHHNDKKVNTTTTFRVSVLEKLYVFTFLAPLLFLGFNVQIIFLALTIISVYQVYVHNCYFGLPKYLSYIFINPALHRIHHDERESSQKSNYGAMLVIWDKLFKTYKDNVENIKIGNKDDSEENFLKNQAKPFIYFYKKIF